MATARKPRPKRENAIANLGLLAYGKSGAWEVSIDETTSGADRWFAQIEGPSVYLSFEILSIDIVGKVISLFERASPASPTSNGESRSAMRLAVGKDKKTPVTLIKDDEYDDRFFFVIGSPGNHNPITRVTIAGTDVAELLKALRQADLEVGC